MKKNNLNLIPNFLLAGTLWASGATYNWNGETSDGAWENPSNWTQDSALYSWPNEQFGNEYINDDANLIEAATGDAITRNGSLSIQETGGSTAYELSVRGGTLLSSGTIWIADDSSTQGLVTVNDGTITISGALEVGDDNECVGTLNMTDGLVSVSGNSIIADNEGSQGMMTLSNSVLTVGDRFYMNDGGGSNYTSNLTMNDNSYIQVTGNTYINDDASNDGTTLPTATVLIDSGSFISGGTFDIPWNGGGVADVTLNKGTIQVGTALRLGAGGSTDGRSRLTINNGLVIAESLVINVADSVITFVDGEFRINEADKTVADINQLITDGKIDVTGAPNYEVIDGGDYTILRNSTGSNSLFFEDPSSLFQDGGTVFFPDLPGSIAAGQSGVTYQWFKDGMAIAGASSSSYSKPNATSADSGEYHLEASAGGTTIAGPPTNLVVEPVFFTGDIPSATTVYAGDFVCFEAPASAATAITYQWEVSSDGGNSYSAVVDGSGITGATTGTLIINATAAGNSGLYRLTASDSNGNSIQTSPIPLNVNTGQYFSENFDRFVDSLEPFVSSSESGGDGTDWTDIAGAQSAGELINWEMTKNSGHGPTNSEATNVPIEFDGWTFLDPVSWDNTAGQGRSSFTKGRKVIAVADSDESDDLDDAAFDATLSTPDINISSLPFGNILTLTFDSSWQAEPQTGTVTISYDGGPDIEVLRYDGSTPSLLDETVNIALPDPAGASNLKINWSKQGANNWWWAIDNIVVRDDAFFFTEQPANASTFEGFGFNLSGEVAGQPNVTYQWSIDGMDISGATSPSYTVGSASFADAGEYVLTATAGSQTIVSNTVFVDVLVVPAPAKVVYEENFDSTNLGTSVQEDVGRLGVWSNTGPNGWVVDRSNVVGVGDPELGIEEWEGWNFADPDWWDTQVAGQNRSDFTRAACATAIADNDEWDDLTFVDVTDPLNRYSAAGAPNALNPDIGEKGGNFNTTLTSPVINLPALEDENSLTLRFASSWRAEDWQEAILEVSFDGAPFTEVLHWNSRSDDTDPGGDPVGANGEPSDTNPAGVFHPDNTNESVTIDLQHAANANNVQLRFTMPFGGNDWWWAVDNIVIYDGSTVPVDILEAPDSVFILAGSSDDVTFDVVPEGVGPYTINWYKDSVVLGNEVGTGDSLTLTSPVQNDLSAEGSYVVTVANPVSSVTTCGNLNVVPFNFLVQPEDQTAAEATVAGDLGAIDASIQGFDNGVIFTWYKDGVAIPGASNDPLISESLTQATIDEFGPDSDGLYTHDITLFIDPLEAADEGDYYVEISNVFGGRQSRTGSLEVLDVVIDPDLSRQSAMLGSNFTFSAKADSINLSIEDANWFKAPFDDATNLQPIDVDNDPRFSANLAFDNTATLTITEVTSEDAGYYQVDFVTDDNGELASTSSSLARLDVFANKLNTPIFSENFDGLDLRDSTSPTETSGVAVWTPVPPADWALDLTTTPTGGPVEFEGWTFADLDWWVTTAGDQDRSHFTNASGNVAIADPDEYDDSNADEGFDGVRIDPNLFNAYLTTPIIDISAVNTQDLVLCFDSSWRPEDLQSAVVEVSFDQGNSWSQLLRYTSAGTDPDFKEDEANASIALPLGNSPANNDVQVRWGCLTAGNDWWYAIDNIEIQADVPVIDITDFSRSGDTLNLSWTSEIGDTYTVEYSTNLTNWSTAETGIASSGNITSETISISGLGIGTPAELFVRIVAGSLPE